MTEAQQSLLERGLKEEARVRIAKVSDGVRADLAQNLR